MAIPNNILSKDEFIGVIGGIVAAHDASNAISWIIKDSARSINNDMLRDFFDPFVLYSGQLESLVKTLEVMFDDKSKWISWWLFECDYGHNEALLETIYGSDGQPIPMRTISNLYALLLSELSQGDMAGAEPGNL